MTTQAPNPRDFNTWEDAFQYPIPVARRLEQQLRGSINENRDKLRTLVGTSYRDLLGTADRIIEMDGQMHGAEELLGDIGRKCNARAIERIAVNHAHTVKTQRDRNGHRNTLASTIALLQNCMTTGSRTIKRGGSPLLAAKLLVLARLLHSSASKSPNPPPLLDTLRTRLASLRRKVLNHIEETLADSKVERTTLIETLSAFSLATTSTPTDVLRHFLNTRAEALTDLLEEPSETSIHSAMDLFLSTLKDAQTVFPRRLTELLARLQDEPLLQDDAVRGTPELNLDIYERWIAEDVRNFTPYLRHDQLQASQATKVIQSWAASAKKTLLEGLKKLLAGLQDAEKVTALRKDVILRSLSADRKLPGLEQAIFFNDLRTCFMQGLRRIAVDTSHDLMAVVTKVLSDDVSKNTPTTPTDVWDPMSVEIDLSKGAVEFRKLIVNCSQGKDSRLQSLDVSMGKWSAQMSALSATIKSMREDRWDDDLDLDLDDDLELDSPQDLLTKEDTQALRKVMDEQKREALSNVYKHIESTISDGSSKPAFLLRLLREVLQHSTTSEVSTTVSVKPPLSLLDTLHGQLAQQVLDRSLAYRKSAKWIPFDRPPSATLWEGTPALPVQPSAASFRFLQETCKTMKEIGSDLWTPSAVDALKIRLLEITVESLEHTVLKQEINGVSKPVDELSSGDVQNKDEVVAEEKKDNDDGELETALRGSRQQLKLAQAMFDVLYLERILAHPSSQAAGALDGAVTRLKGKLSLEEVGVERLRKSSMDYYKRTYLLFGLVAA